MILSSSQNEKVPIIHGADKDKTKMQQEEITADRSKIIYTKPINNYNVKSGKLCKRNYDTCKGQSSHHSNKTTEFFNTYNKMNKI